MEAQSKPGPSRTAVFTIVSANYLHYARVLMRSLEGISPAWERFVLLADRLDGAFDTSRENFTTVEAGELPLPDREQFIFRYTILEFNTAVKPWFFRKLFQDGFDRVIYLDPDIFVYAPLVDVQLALDSGALAALVPHLTGRLLGQARPSEHDILQAGAYNLGFCALARHRCLADLLDFWCEKSVRDFVVDLQRGLFTDQRWMDLVPGMFPDVRILRHDGYDVAYWNLAHRKVVAEGGRITVNGQPLVFFHFSGVEPGNPASLSRHQNRFDLASAAAVGELVAEYVRLLREAGLAECSHRRYAFGYLADGSPLPDVFRHLYRSTAEVQRWAGGDPYTRSAADWNASVDDASPPVSRAMLAVYQARPDLRLAWPRVFGADRAAFARWFIANADAQRLVPACYVEPIRLALNNGSIVAGASMTSPANPETPSPLRPELVVGALRKAAVALKERRLPISPRRWLQLYNLHTFEQAQIEAARSPRLPAFEWPAGEMGVTVVGYTSDGTGLSSAAESSVSACAAAGLPSELLDARPLRPVRATYRHALLHVNADQMKVAANMLGADFFLDRYAIGVWAWELPEFPDQYAEAFQWVNEVWAGSRFIQAAVSAKSPVPVVHMPYAVQAFPSPLPRDHFDLPTDRFLFLTMYDALSIHQRKNPIGAIDAFAKAFGSSPEVGIVVKVNNASRHPDEVARVRQRVAETAGAYLVDTAMSRADAQALQACCDAFVSLHRAEGFGLNIAEAMLLEKPVIVTAWSGNMDFTTARNACLVDYQMSVLTDTFGPYQAGNQWAEPDLEHAAEWMKRVADDRALRSSIGSLGRQTIATSFSPAAVGRMYRRRLESIARHRSEWAHRTQVI